MRHHQKLTMIFAVLFIFFTTCLIVTDAQPSIYTIQGGTKIKVRMDNEINSKVSSINDTFTATVSSSVMVREVEIIPAGSIVEGRVVNVKAASAFKTNGNIKVKFERLKLPDEVIRYIDAGLVDENLVEDKSSSAKELVVFGGIATGTIIGALAGKTKGAIIGAGVGAGIGASLTLFGKGKEARIRANQEFEILLNKEVIVPVKDY